MERRRIGTTDLFISPVAMGCWPITGITSVGVTEGNSLATLQAAADVGINLFDTAYSYGYDGESERLIARVLGHRRKEIIIATKGGLHWESPGKQARDATPATLRRQCEESLRRLDTEHVDLLYLHAPDPKVPLAESAGTLRELMQEGKTRAVGVSNVTAEQMKEFASACPLAAYQPHYNMFQREMEQSHLPWCIANCVSVLVYWPLMKGLLAGKLMRDHVFDERDGRPKYPMFQGQEWQKNQDFVDELRTIAMETGRTVAQLVLNWTFHQPGITAVLAGAKHPEQIRENAGSMDWKLSEAHLALINDALGRRGKPVSRGATG
ncbi:MAG: aldo/keto reductase [Gemmataceae bacterium]|nr:aldo/keto reductase [Gemmataceae bacterium]